MIDQLTPTPAEVLRSAADYITQHGRIRCKLMVRSTDQSALIGCAIGTCQIVAHFDAKLSRAAVNAAAQLLPEKAAEWSTVMPGLLSSRLARFNDDVTTTDDDVVELFIQAAEKLEADQ